MMLHHITLSSGNSVTHRLDTLDAGAVASCTALLPARGPVPGYPAFRVVPYGPVFTIYRGAEPLVLCGIGAGIDDTWRALCDVQAKFAPVSAEPPAGQWLAVVLLPPIANTSQADVGWFADFERCMAAAMLEVQP
jgi:hypothetical protein